MNPLSLHLNTLTSDANLPQVGNRIAASAHEARKPQFSGLQDQVLLQASRGLNPLVQGAAKFLKMKEGSGGNAHMQFVQDTAILWAPKAAISRSPIELYETTFVEFIESACFYYVPPLLGGMVLSKLFSKIGKKGFRPSLTELSNPLKMVAGKIQPAGLSRIVPAKLGLAVASVGIATAIQYALNFIKNVSTEKGFNKNDFSSIIGYSHKIVEKNADTEVSRKAKRRLIQCALASVGLLGGGLLFARYGHLLGEPAMQRLSGVARWFDFDFKQVTNKVTGKVSNRFDLGGNQLKILMPFAIYTYIDAARDKLERIEVGCRATITGSYIAYIQPWAERAFNRSYGKVFSHLNIMTGDFAEKIKTPQVQKDCAEEAKVLLKNAGIKPSAESVSALFEHVNSLAKSSGDRVKSLAQIQTDCIAEARTILAKSGQVFSEQDVIQKAARLFKPRLVAKSQLFFIPFLFGILVIGLFTALMNQTWTAYRYKKAIDDNKI